MGENKDETRDAFLSEKGLQILRISNLDIDRNFKGVCELIDLKIKGLQA